MPLKVAKRRYGRRLRIAPIGAKEKADETNRSLHDETHGAGANPNLRIRDQLRDPGGQNSNTSSPSFTKPRGRHLDWWLTCPKRTGVTSVGPATGG